MKYELKMTDFTLNDGYYKYETEDFEIEIVEEEFTEAEIKYTSKLVNLYKENLSKIAAACKQSKTFQYCYPTEEIQSIISKLEKPIFRRMGKMTILTYTQHKFDEDHILDIVFEGIYDDIYDISLDG